MKEIEGTAGEGTRAPVNTIPITGTSNNTGRSSTGMVLPTLSGPLKAAQVVSGDGHFFLATTATANECAQLSPSTAVTMTTSLTEVTEEDGAITSESEDEDYVYLDDEEEDLERQQQLERENSSLHFPVVVSPSPSPSPPPRPPPDSFRFRLLARQRGHIRLRINAEDIEDSDSEDDDTNNNDDATSTNNDVATNNGKQQQKQQKGEDAIGSSRISPHCKLQPGYFFPPGRKAALSHSSLKDYVAGSSTTRSLIFAMDRADCSDDDDDGFNYENNYGHDYDNNYDYDYDRSIATIQSGDEEESSYCESENQSEDCDTLLSTSSYGSASIRYYDREDATTSTHKSKTPLAPNDAKSYFFRKGVSWSSLLGNPSAQSDNKSAASSTAASTKSAFSTSLSAPPLFQVPDSPASSTSSTSTLGEKISQAERLRSADRELLAIRSSNRGLDNYLNTMLKDISGSDSQRGSRSSNNVSTSQRTSSKSDDDVSRKKRKVQFGDVEVREMPTILGCAPTILGGPSMTMGWTVQRTSFHKISDMENYRQRDGQCSLRQKILPLTATERIELMHYECGYSLQEIDDASKVSQFFHQQRLETTLLDLLDNMDEHHHIIPEFPPPVVLPPILKMMDDSRSPDELLQQNMHFQMVDIRHSYQYEDPQVPPLRRPEADEDDIDRVSVPGCDGRPLTHRYLDDYNDDITYQEEKMASRQQHQSQKPCQPRAVERLQKQVEHEFQREQLKQRELEKRFVQIQQEQHQEQQFIDDLAYNQ